MIWASVKRLFFIRISSFDEPRKFYVPGPLFPGGITSFHGRADFINPEFREALLAVAGDGGAISGKRLGKWLSANQGRIVNTMRITPDGIVSGISRWRLRGSSDEAAQSMPHASNIRRFPHHQG